MQASCLRHTELPHTSQLFADFLYHFDRVMPFYSGISAPPEMPPERRAALVAALREQNGDSPSLELLARPGTVAVVTGQQVGLYSGPAYTIYKALTAVRYARELTEHGTPAVPVFWLATEDHDFAEVNHAWVFDERRRPVSIRVAGEGSGEQPVGGIRLEQWPNAQLRDVLSGLPYADDVLGLVESAYSPGETFGQAFRKLLEPLLKDTGLLYMDPLQPAMRALAAPILREAVDAAPDLAAALLQRGRELADRGYHAQVHFEEKTSLFFLLDGGRRIALRRQNGMYAGKDRRYTQAELRDRAEHISPNALLRPVVQDFMLPTAAYIGGPAELAYLAQSEVIYSQLLGRMPRPIHRAGFTLIDPVCVRVMQRYGVRLQDCFHGEELLRERMAEALVPAGLTAEFENARGQAAGLLAHLKASVQRFDPTLQASLEKSEAKILYQLEKASRKVAREAIRRSGRAAEDAALFYNSLFPHKHPQERFYSILPFLALHGLDLVDKIAGQIRLECPDHVLLEMN